MFDCGFLVSYSRSAVRQIRLTVAESVENVERVSEFVINGDIGRRRCPAHLRDSLDR